MGLMWCVIDTLIFIIAPSHITRALLGGGGAFERPPPPSGFSRIAKKPRRAAPPGFP